MGNNINIYIIIDFILPNAIYATSNRRHLVKEQFSSRDGDEIHVSDTLQEIMSLSARFGITVTFERPDKETYLSIVKQIAASSGVPVNEQLLVKAESFAIRNNGRSPRAESSLSRFKKRGFSQPLFHTEISFKLKFTSS